MLFFNKHICDDFYVMIKKYTNTDEVLTKLGQRMQSLRRAKGFKNRDHFAYMNEINRVQYGRYENGQGYSLFHLASRSGCLWYYT